MPLSGKARIEIFLPDLPKQAYQRLLDALRIELTYTFGGVTVIRGLDGTYLSRSGMVIADRINLIFTDTPLSFERNFTALSDYADELRNAAFEALEEEAVLVVALQVFHAE